MTELLTIFTVILFSETTKMLQELWADRRQLVAISGFLRTLRIFR